MVTFNFNPPGSEKTAEFNFGDPENKTELSGGRTAVSPASLEIPESCWQPRRKSHSKRDKYLAKLEAAKAESDEKYIGTLKLLCLYDLFFLCREILGYKDLEEPLHDDMCDFMEKADMERRSTLTLIPRAHFKSTICTIGRSIQWILRDKNIAIGLFSGNMKQARKFAIEIRSNLENNENLKRLFPEVLFQNPIKESPLWTRDEFTVRRDPDKSARKEGTLKIFGLLQNIPTGDHFDKLLGDDIVDQDIVGSEDQMVKVEDQLQYLIPLQQTPDDPIHLVGTRYHILDAYGKLMDDPNYDVYFRRDIEHKKAIFPSRFTIEMLERTRLKMGNYKYYCQFRMDPQDPADKKFKLKWLRSYKHWGTRESSQPYYNFYMIVDPAHQQKKESDFTAMMVLAVDYKFNLYFVDAIHDKLNPKQRIDAVFHLVNKWKVPQVGYETIAFQDTDKFWIERQMLKLNKYFQIIEVSHRKQNKFDYIMSTQPVYQAGEFFLPDAPLYYNRKWENPDDGFAQTVDVVELFRNQYDLFPNLVHDDLLDAVAMGVHIMRAGNIRRPDKPSDLTLAQAYPHDNPREEEFDPRAH